MEEAHTNLHGAIAVVTGAGAGSGIGQGIASALLEKGAQVIACDRDSARLEAFQSKSPPGAGVVVSARRR